LVLQAYDEPLQHEKLEGREEEGKEERISSMQWR
jgi:hypothetical protein